MHQVNSSCNPSNFPQPNTTFIRSAVWIHRATDSEWTCYCKCKSTTSILVRATHSSPTSSPPPGARRPASTRPWAAPRPMRATRAGERWPMRARHRVTWPELTNDRLAAAAGRAPSWTPRRCPSSPAPPSPTPRGSSSSWPSAPRPSGSAGEPQSSDSSHVSCCWPMSVQEVRGRRYWRHELLLQDHGAAPGQGRRTKG